MVRVVPFLTHGVYAYTLYEAVAVIFCVHYPEIRGYYA